MGRLFLGLKKTKESSGSLKKVKSQNEAKDKLEKSRRKPCLKSDTRIGRPCKGKPVSYSPLADDIMLTSKYKKMEEKLKKVKSDLVLLMDQIYTKLATPEGEAEILDQISKAIKKRKLSPSLLNIILNTDLRKRRSAIRVISMKKSEILLKLGSDEGIEEIIQQISKAIKLGRISPYLIEMLINKGKTNKFLKILDSQRSLKQEVSRKLGTTTGELKIIKDVGRAIKHGQVSPSTIVTIVNKCQEVPLFKRLSIKRIGQRQRPMTKNEILAKLGTKDGKSEILNEIDKGKYEL
ncbi:uncharacterized protein LOC135116780 [Helicoverpa armigera]|uniref:uncharacterized protein LOC135116780 n=1 Tax=Helicoverpa armigera TaxID=29058 RepID=UPI003082F7F0